jgi:hypothetical protein
MKVSKKPTMVKVSDLSTWFGRRSTDSLPTGPSTQPRDRDNYQRGYDNNGNRGYDRGERVFNRNGAAGYRGERSADVFGSRNDRWDGLGYNRVNRGGGFGDRDSRNSFASFGSRKPTFSMKTTATTIVPQAVQPAPIPAASNQSISLIIDKKASRKEKHADKKKEKEEVARRAKEAKDQKEAKEAAELQRLEDDEATAKTVVGDVIGSDLKGAELCSYIEKLEVIPTGSVLISEVLLNLEDPLSTAWCRKSEYGSAIAMLVSGNKKAQIRALNEIQLHCNKLKFPKVDTKSGARGLIEILFELCYTQEVIDYEGFVAWSEDNAEVPGKINAIVQTTNFIRLLSEQDFDNDEDENEEEEIDAPLPTIK